LQEGHILVRCGSILTFQVAPNLTVPFMTVDIQQPKEAAALALNLMWVE